MIESSCSNPDCPNLQWIYAFMRLWWGQSHPSDRATSCFDVPVPEHWSPRRRKHFCEVSSSTDSPLMCARRLLTEIYRSARTIRAQRLTFEPEQPLQVGNPPAEHAKDQPSAWG